ncbi:MAG: nucleotidyltransferase domain-containing protein [Candidatus Riflebacteria bacterium]|nr:nucleotidyltransferase domain-containing protein [Candidatus Riflebacteria bacterium]
MIPSVGSQRAGRRLATAHAVELLHAFFQARPEVRLAWLFGSRGRGDGSDWSDVDVAVWCGGRVPEVPWGYPALVAAELMDLLGTGAVDVALFETASPLLAHRIVTEGVVLCCRDEAEQVRCRARALLRYLDTQPLRDLEARYLALRQSTKETSR